MPVFAVLPGPSALATPVPSALAGLLPAPSGPWTPVLALPPCFASAFPVLIALVPVAGWPLGAGGAADGTNTAQASATMPVAHWTDPATSCPASGPPSSQYAGVRAIPAPAIIPIMIFQRRETRTPDPPPVCGKSGTTPIRPTAVCRRSTICSVRADRHLRGRSLWLTRYRQISAHQPSM